MTGTAPLPEVFMYHHVEPAPWEPPPRHPGSYVTPDDFARQLDLLAARGYRTVTLAEAAGTAAPDTTPAGRRIVLTFDDGCRCFERHVLPALASRGMTATLFAVAELLGETNRWDAAEGERTEELLDADGLRRMAEAGIEIGCHGASHASLTATDTDLAREIVQAKARLEELLGRPVETFCYPYGAVSPGAREAVRRAGFRAAVGIVDHGIARRGDLWALPRWPVGPGEAWPELPLKASGLYRHWRRLPRLGILGALRDRHRRQRR